MRTLFHKSFDKRFAKLPLKVQLKALERIQLFRGNPFAAELGNHALTGKYLGLRSINITGDYRAVYDPIADNVVMFVDIGTHSQLYD